MRFNYLNEVTNGFDYKRNLSALLGYYKKKSLIYKLHLQKSPWASMTCVHRVYFDNGT